MAWEQVGDERDQAAVIRLSGGEGPSRHDPALRRAARACLPYLYVNGERRRTEPTLLRTCESDDSWEGLLRPIVGGQSDRALLRPCAPGIESLGPLSPRAESLAEVRQRGFNPEEDT